MKPAAHMPWQDIALFVSNIELFYMLNMLHLTTNKTAKMFWKTKQRKFSVFYSGTETHHSLAMPRTHWRGGRVARRKIPVHAGNRTPVVQPIV
jgi:hypothetical protein